VSIGSETAAPARARALGVLGGGDALEQTTNSSEPSAPPAASPAAARRRLGQVTSTWSPPVWPSESLTVSNSSRSSSSTRPAARPPKAPRAGRILEARAVRQPGERVAARAAAQLALERRRSDHVGGTRQHDAVDVGIGEAGRRRATSACTSRPSRWTRASSPRPASPRSRARRHERVEAARRPPGRDEARQLLAADVGAADAGLDRRRGERDGRPRV
jgi:hypothetical protein